MGFMTYAIRTDIAYDVGVSSQSSEAENKKLLKWLNHAIKYLLKIGTMSGGGIL